MHHIIIIPTYNEVDNVKNMIRKIFDEIFPEHNISVLIVDGNSPDKTADAVEEMKSNYKNLFLIRQQTKNGLAGAYIEGFKWALENGFDVFVQMDCDFQHPVEILPKMIDETQNYDLVIGSRYTKGGGWDKTNNDIKKQFTSRLGSLYARTVLGGPINDFTGGFNIYTKKALTSINLDKIKSKGYCFQIEMKYYTYKAGLKIKEYPIIFRPRLSGESKMDFDIIYETAINIWNIKKGNF